MDKNRLIHTFQQQRPEFPYNFPPALEQYLKERIFLVDHKKRATASDVKEWLQQNKNKLVTQNKSYDDNAPAESSIVLGYTMQD